MSFLLVAVGYPIVLGLLSLGIGLLAQSASGARLSVLPLVATGFAALIVIGQFTALAAPLAPLTPWIYVILMLAGLWLGRSDLRSRFANRERGYGSFHAVGATVLAYLAITAPLWASFRLTFPGYLLNTDSGFQLAGSEWMLHHGQDITNHSMAYGQTLIGYWGHGYPSGGQVAMAATGWLTGQDLLWLIFPFQAFALALVGGLIAHMVRRAGLKPLAATLAGLMTAIPALTYAYVLEGSIKEFTALPSLFLMGALFLASHQLIAARVRGAIPFGLAAGGAVAGVGLSAMPWVAGFGLLALGVVAIESHPQADTGVSTTAPPRNGLRNASRYAAQWLRGLRAAPVGIALVALGAWTIVFCIPTLTRLSTELNIATGVSGNLASNPGNLFRTLRFVQVFGIWLGDDFRVDPKYAFQTYLLIGIAVAATGLGVMALARRRAWKVLSFLAMSFVVFAVLIADGNAWLDAKLLVMVSPAVVAFTMFGALNEFGVRKLQNGLLTAVVVFGIGYSDAMLYHSTNMAPTQRFQELEAIEHRFDGKGPTLLPDFDLYALYMLRHMDIDGPGMPITRNWTMAPGVGTQFGNSYDMDQIGLGSVEQFNLIVEGRYPRWSRPPSNFKLVHRGRFYDVWKKAGTAPTAHLPVTGTDLDPVGTPPCKQVKTLARTAPRTGASLLYATRAPNATADMADASVSGAAVLQGTPDLPSVSMTGASQINASVTVPKAGRYHIWISGDDDRKIEVSVDDKYVGSDAYESGGNNMLNGGTVFLQRGKHTVTLIRPGGSLRPGDAWPSSIGGIYLLRQTIENEQIHKISTDKWHTLCGRHDVDWVEIGRI